MTLATVSQMIADKFQVAVDTITVDTKLKEDLNIDSLDSVEMVMELEDKFSISIKDEDAAKFLTVGDIVNYIDAQAQ
jgi:acyl carrier protein